MVVVFGSINLDFVARVPRFPTPGETVAAESFATHPGGKGANQALAAARAGAAVSLYGAVGTDAFAAPALALLDAGRVDLRSIVRVAGPTGCATILVDAQGENCIAVAAGANALAEPREVPDSVLGSGTVLVLQHEVPAEANVALIARAHRLGARIVLNAAPARAVSAELLRQVDVLIVNETEAAAVAVANGWPARAAAFAAAATAAARGLAAVVTLGKDGALAACGSDKFRARPSSIAVVDTTGAGDAFVGNVAAALDASLSLAEALRRAVAAGSLACTRAGAQPALPDRAAIDAALPSVTVEADASW